MMLSWKTRRAALRDAEQQKDAYGQKVYAVVDEGQLSR